MLVPDLELARRFIAANPPPGALLFVAVTGAHNYGFASVDSDIDLKGMHLAPTQALLGLGAPKPTHDRLQIFQNEECDLTTHEAAKALGLLLGASLHIQDTSRRTRLRTDFRVEPPSNTAGICAGPRLELSPQPPTSARS